MKPRTQAILVGSVAGLVAWGVWFALFVKRTQPALEARAQEIAPAIAEQAALGYIAEKYGLTPEILQRITIRVGTVTNLVNAFSSLRS